MPLESIYIQNFQTHEDLRINFDPSITTLVGPTNSGKSAVLRAFRWLCLNRPAGDSFIRNGSDSVQVKLVVDGQKIIRRRARDDNSYSLDGKSFHALRSEVPEQVQQILNVGKDNFQGQHDPPYWFSLTAGEVSRELNSIVDLSAIDRTLANLASELRTAKAAVEVTEDRLRSARERRGELDWAIEADRDLKRIEALSERLAENRQKRGVLTSLIENGERLTQIAREAAEALKMGVVALSLGDRARQTRERAEGLQDLLDRITESQTGIAKLRQELQLEQSKLNKITRCPLCGSGSQRNSDKFRKTWENPIDSLSEDTTIVVP